jgi:ParB/RepB/Spo0J family partition protein
VHSNPRTDFGNIDELGASIREKGIIEPLVVKKLDEENYELVAGERRLRAAKAVGLENVPVAVRAGDETEIEEVKLIENIHRKDFNPIEEGKAFQKYLDSTKVSVDTLAQKIAKPKIYAEKRLEILKLPEEIQIAISEGKISMSHGLVIARLNTKKEQKKLFKEITTNKFSVNQTERQIQYLDTTINMSDAIFDKSECNGCQHNGGEQSMLFDTGSELKGICLNKKCYHKKTSQYIKDETKKHKEKGINVMTERQLEQVKRKERVDTYHSDYKDIMKRLSKEPEVFAVVFGQEYYGSKIKKMIYCIKPNLRNPKKAAAQKDEKAKAQDRMAKLKGKVFEFRTGFLIGKTQELIQPSTRESKAMTLFALLKEATRYGDGERQDKAEKLIKDEKIGVSHFSGYYAKFDKILALEESDIDRLIATVSGYWVRHLEGELRKASQTFGVDLKQHFQITEEYLKPYTKDALIALATEIGLDKHLEGKGIEKWDKAKRGDIVSYFLNEGFDLRGKVPKIMAQGR